jgi:hypothetical protein
MNDSTKDADKRGDRIGAPRALSALVAPLTRRALGKHGFSSAALISDWDVIVGPELAASCQPVKLAFRRGEREGGVLHVNVSGGAALEIQHIAPQLIERINGHLGYRAVDRLKLVHGLVARPRGAQSSRARRTRTGPVAPVDPSRWPALTGITDAGLRESLLRLGAAIADRESNAKK